MLAASKILARPNDSGQRMLRRTSGCRKNVFSSQSPRKTVPGDAISAKVGRALLGTRAIHRAARALLPAQREIAAARLQRGGAQQVDFEIAGGDGGGIAGAHEAHLVAAAGAQRLLFDALRRTARHALRS